MFYIIELMFLQELSGDVEEKVACDGVTFSGAIDVYRICAMVDIFKAYRDHIRLIFRKVIFEDFSHSASPFHSCRRG